MTELRNRFKAVTPLLEYFSVPHMMQVRRQEGISNLATCVSHSYPTLCDVKNSHGIECMILLVEVFVVNLNDSGNLHRMEPEQITETAELIYEECPTLKITELYEFFRCVKKGHYGNFYGSFDCIKIMTAFRQFMQDRTAAISAIVQAREKERRRQLEQFQKKLPKEREAWLKTLTDEQKIELMVCPACHSTLIRDINAKIRCISCNYKRK